MCGSNVLIIVLCFLVGGAVGTITTQVHIYIFHGNPYFESVLPEFFRNIWNYGYLFCVWSAIYLGLKNYGEFILQKQNADRAESLAQNAQLEMLRYQINPHFLFNTLNSARTLVQVDPPQAEEMLTQISEFLRYSLSEGKKNSVPLAKELGAIKAYLDIEKIRFNNNLIVEYNVDPKAEMYDIPVFLILPLIENAIKHGMKTTSLPLKIYVNAKPVGSFLQIDIINTGKWIETTDFSTDANTGTGLQNVRRRLESSFKDNFEFNIIKENDLIHAMMKIRMEIK
jgi:two-component system, LytTR family, sensor kinase